MKIRRSVFLLVAIAVAVIALIVWLGEKTADTPLPLITETNDAAAAMQRAAEPSHRKPSSIPSANLSTGQVSALASTSAAPQIQWKDRRMREGLAMLNDEQVVLYGRVVDQFDSPVAGAKVAGSIQVNSGARVGTDIISLNTDADGLFTVSGYTGKAIGIKISKPGYVMATANTRFVYSLLWPEAERHVPDPNNPVVFRMWKLQGAEPLVRIDQHYKIESTSGPANFDLLAGKIVPNGGDLRITVNRPLGVVSQRQPQDWELKVEAVDGGLIKTSFAEARVTFQAPEAGYRPSDLLVMSATNHWSDLVQEMFYLNSRNGHVYSKVFLSFRINANPDEPSLVSFRGEANANASRNWEATAPQ